MGKKIRKTLSPQLQYTILQTHDENRKASMSDSSLQFTRKFMTNGKENF